MASRNGAWVTHGRTVTNRTTAREVSLRDELVTFWYASVVYQRLGRQVMCGSSVFRPRSVLRGSRIVYRHQASQNNLFVEIASFAWTMKF